MSSPFLQQVIKTVVVDLHPKVAETKVRELVMDTSDTSAYQLGDVELSSGDDDPDEVLDAENFDSALEVLGLAA